LRFLTYGTVVLQLKQAADSPIELVKTQMTGPDLRVSDSVALSWNLRICISSKFPGAATGLGAL
jgi:hypothetical protein